ncbi:MAG: hypothetical protein QCI38_08600 [Candidatus Thermoplasmatota archaeon]|nr:hypothetical protein [Candidatus Thermoplasmatota archaeon]
MDMWPDVNTIKPVSRQKESDWRKNMGHPVEERKGDPHLRETKEILGYQIINEDGPVGFVEDLLAEDTAAWDISYMGVKTGRLFGKDALISPECVENISWTEEKIKIGMSKEAVEDSPEYNPDNYFNEEKRVLVCDK